MKRMTLAAAVLAASLAASASASELKGLIKNLVEKGADEAPVSAAAVTNIDMRLDCERVTFETGAPNVSAPIELESETWIEEQDCFGAPPHGRVCIPRRRLMSRDQRTATVSIPERAASDPKEVFNVCLQGRWLSIRTVKSPYKYKDQEKDGLFTLTRKPRRQ